MWAVVVNVVMMMTSVVVRAAPQPGTSQEVELLMPKVRPQVPDTYLCQAMKMEDAHTYITGFIPTADAKIAHHILLYGCQEPGAAPGEIWNCGEMSSKSSNYKLGSVCKAGSNILYAWAMEAPRLTLPPDVSFDVGQDTDIKYLVVQVHYKNVTKFLPPQNGDDSSGLTLVTQSRPTQKQAGVYLMLTGGAIPPHTVEYFEAACDFDEEIEIVPFAYRTHAHALGRVISGYRIRDGQWTEIGRKDPRLPEMFYNATNPGITVKRGDILAARCTMENNLDHEVAIGATQNDEMCNFYIMYYVNKPPVLKDHECITQGPPTWYWKDFWDQDKLNLDGMPDTASVIPGTEKPLVRNATQDNEYKRAETVEGLPGRFEDIAADAVVDEAIRDMKPDELLQLVNQLVQEEEEEEEMRSRMMQQQHQQQQQRFKPGQQLWIPYEERDFYRPGFHAPP